MFINGKIWVQASEGLKVIGIKLKGKEKTCRACVGKVSGMLLTGMRFDREFALNSH